MTVNGKNGSNGHHAAPPTRRECRKIWESLGKVTPNELYVSLWSSGRPIEIKILERWCARWMALEAKPSEKQAHFPAPRDLESAVEKLDELVPVVTDPLTRTRQLVARMCESELLEQTRNMDEAQLTRFLSKRAQETMVLLLDEVKAQRTKLVAEQGDPLAKLVLAIGRAMEMALIGYDKAIFLNERMSGIKPGEQEILPPVNEDPDPLARTLAVYARH